MKRSFPIKFWKVRAFERNQHIISIMYANDRFQWIGTSDSGRKFAKNYMNDKIFEKETTLKL